MWVGEVFLDLRSAADLAAEARDDLVSGNSSR
jgi:hypothetical protein